MFLLSAFSVAHDPYLVTTLEAFADVGPLNTITALTIAVNKAILVILSSYTCVTVGA
jgi:hypothetical protein